MAWWGDGISVYPLTAEWRFSVSQDGVSGTRTYLENKGQLSGITAQTLPKIGDAWSTDYLYCTCKSIDVSYINDNPNCNRKFTVNYDGSVFIQTLQLQSDDLPKNVEIGGELDAIEPYEEESGVGTIYYYKWNSDNADVKQPIYFHHGIANIRYTKVVKDIKTYIKTCMTYVGHVNSGVFFGFPEEMIMFEGCSMYQFKNKMGHDRWKVELNFAVRNVTDDFDAAGKNGWNWVLRKDGKGAAANGKWDKPVIKDGVNAGKSLYSTKDFDLLISETDLFEDEDYYNQFPSS